MKPTMKTKGYVVVASSNFFYYISAINLIHSIKDNDPKAKVCLVTEQRFVDKGADIADEVIFCKNHIRSKLYGMAKSPYDQTFYIDADCETVHKDLATVFDKFENNDIMFTSLVEERSYIYAELGWGTKGEKFTWCGGVCLYDFTNPLVREFMEDWNDLTIKQYNGSWWPRDNNGKEDYDNYPKSLKRWDQFSLWWLINKEPKYELLKIGRLDGDDDARWNHFTGYYWDHCNGKPPIIVHYSNVDVKKMMRDQHR